MPMRLRMRPDLIIRQQRSDARSAWTVKDPVSLRYYIFTPQEFAILRWLDGARSADDIRREYERACRSCSETVVVAWVTARDPK